MAKGFFKNPNSHQFYKRSNKLSLLSIILWSMLTLCFYRGVTRATAENGWLRLLVPNKDDVHEMNYLDQETTFQNVFAPRATTEVDNLLIVVSENSRIVIAAKVLVLGTLKFVSH